MTFFKGTSTLDHHMQLAHRDKRAYNLGRCRKNRRLVLPAALLLTVVTASAADFTLDLTERRPDDDLLPPITLTTGAEREGVKPIALPLEITIQDVSPLTPAVIKDELQLQILVRNTAKEPIAIPASQHYSDTMKNGNEDRRTMAIHLAFTVEGTYGVISKAPIFEAIAVAVGSSSVPGSMVMLGPGQSVLIYAKGPLSNTQEWDKRGSGLFIATAKAILRERFIYDDRLWDRNYAQDVVSTNSVPMTVWWKPAAPGAIR
jgi:hypothetical protein